MATTDDLTTFTTTEFGVTNTTEQETATEEEVSLTSSVSLTTKFATTSIAENFQNVTSIFTMDFSPTLPHSTNETDRTVFDLIDHDYLLQKENDSEALALTPVTVYLVILMIIGVFGNLLVLYVYKFRFRRSSSRAFILSLAAFDIMTCLLGMPFHILDMVYPYKFVWDGACKALSFSLTFTILASIFVLDLIAIDRYRKICLPFEKQLSGKGTKLTCWITAFIAAILAIPILFIYGSADVDTRFPNVTGKECYISNDLEDTDIPFIYDVFNVLVFLISVFILTVLYIKVGIVVWKRRSFHDSIRDGSKRSNSGTSTPDTIVSSMHNINEEVKIGTSASVHFNKGTHENASIHLLNAKSPICKTGSSASCSSPKTRKKEEKLHRKRLQRLMSELSSASGDESTLERGAGNSKYKLKKQMRTHRITCMLFVITLIFVISFLPYLTISILNSMDEEFWGNMSITELVFVNLLLRTYFINNMINPIVYWFLDKKFKQEVYKFFRDVRKCKWSKTFRLDNKATTS